VTDWKLWLGGAIAGAVLALVVFGLVLGAERYAESEAAKAAEERK
jgi:hypothetical protein